MRLFYRIIPVLLKFISVTPPLPVPSPEKKEEGRTTKIILENQKKSGFNLVSEGSPTVD